MRFEIEKLICVCVRANRKRLSQQLIGCLHGVLPIAQGNIQSQAREDRICFGRGPGEFVPCSIDPGNGVLGASGFAIAIDNVQVRGVYALAVGILLEVLRVTRRSFGSATHAQKG